MDVDEVYKIVYYSIDGGDYERKFVIGELNGIVYLNWFGDGFDCEKVLEYMLIVVVISWVNNIE